METLTFVFTDIEGSTTLLGRLGEGAYAQVLADHHALIRSGLAAHGGQEVDTQGDAFFAVFTSPKACVAAVTQIQQALEAHPWPAGERVRVRMGVHTGEAAKTATGLVGLDVHRAARVAAAGHGGQVLLSETAAALVRGSLPPGAALRDLGSHRLKDLGRPEQIFQLDAAGLETGFPPLRSLGNPALPNNLPAQLASFIGRGRELAELRALVKSSRLVTLTGAGGAGKTRLGLQVAAELLDGSGDGVWLVELAAVAREDAVAAAVCQTLGLAAQPGRPALEILVDALAPQDALIVLDNCEHLIGGCAQAADVILRRCPRVHLVATSREPLRIGGETVYRVPPLSLPAAGDDVAAAGPSDAVTLFAERAREQGIHLPVDEETGRLVVAVCARLDGMPLAIELAAARLGSLSLRALHDRLGQRFRLLTGGSRAALGRQQTLEATVGWSYALLNGAEQSLLGRLSVLAGSFDLDAAEAVGGFGDIQAPDVAGLLGSLVDKSLVVAEPAGETLRYRLLETIRQFAADRLTETRHDEAAAAAAAHSAHYLAVAETAAPHLYGREQGAWYDRLDADVANLRRAAEHAAAQPGGTVQILRFAVALERYLGIRPRSQELWAGLPLIAALERPGAPADPALYAEALLVASSQWGFVHLTAAIQYAEQAAGIAAGIGDDRLLALSQAWLSQHYYHIGEPERALALAQAAVGRARRLGDDVLLGMSLFMYGKAAGAEASGPLYAEAIACTDRCGDLAWNSDAHMFAGGAALETGDLPSARNHLAASIQAAEAIGDPHLVASVTLAEVLRAEHDYDAARSTYANVVRISRQMGSVHIVWAVLGLAHLAADLGDWHRAAKLHGIAQTMADQIGLRWEPSTARERQESLDRISAALGEEQLQHAYTHGSTLSFGQAIDLALGGPLPAT